MIEILSDKNVKTRKPHRCFLCSRKFETGTEMNCQVNKYDDINRVYSCKTCKKLMADNWIEPNDENMFEQDTLSEYMHGDNFNGTPEEYLEFKKRINLTMKAYIKKMAVLEEKITEQQYLKLSREEQDFYYSQYMISEDGKNYYDVKTAQELFNVLEKGYDWKKEFRLNE